MRWPSYAAGSRCRGLRARAARTTYPISVEYWDPNSDKPEESTGWVRFVRGLPATHYNTGNPQDYYIAGQPLAAIGKPSDSVVAFCNSYGAHYSLQDSDVVPKIFGGNGREENGATLAVFADGHARFKTGKFWDLVRTVMAPLNQ